MNKQVLQMDLSAHHLTKQEEKLIHRITKYNNTLTCSIILLIAACYIWVRHFHHFMQGDMFFVIYNAIFYVGLVWAVFASYATQKKINALLDKLINQINSRT